MTCARGSVFVATCVCFLFILSGCGTSDPASDVGVAPGTARVASELGAPTADAGSALNNASSGSGAPLPLDALGLWTFDDCSNGSTDLVDASFSGNTAVRSPGVACQPGVSGLSVSLSNRDDVVQVVDQATFTFEQGVTLAGWFKPVSLRGVQTLLRKGSPETSAVALLLSGNQYQLVVNLGRGRSASVSAPAPADQFTHVAGTYDGTYLRLYLNGAQAASLRASGRINDVPGPLLIGNDRARHAFAGRIDNVFFDRRAATAEQVLGLSCIFRPHTVSALPAKSLPISAGMVARFDVAITNNNSRSCAPESFGFFPSSFIPGVDIEPQFETVTLSTGTRHLSLTATPDQDVDPGTYPIAFSVFAEPPIAAPQGQIDGQVELVVKTVGCRVNRGRELFIKNIAVVEDPLRTTSNGPPADARTGAWTFKRLVENMAPTPTDAPAMVEAMLRSFTVPQTINTFVEQPRDQMQSLVLDHWPRAANGALDLARAPLRLLAIVNRFDLRNLAAGDAGEGRIVFNIIGPDGEPLSAQVIFEYKLPAANAAEVTGWANAWHALGALPFPSERYNAALQAITDRFDRRNARPGHVNGNAIERVCTNEVALDGSGVWQLRQFGLSPASGLLKPVPTRRTPDNRFKGSAALAAFINQNEAAILRGNYELPATFQSSPFIGGGVFNDLNGWTAAGINNNDARQQFSLNTCNGCHSLGETNTFFFQVFPRQLGTESALSPFITGTTVTDPVSGDLRTLNDLRRRADDLEAVVCR